MPTSDPRAPARLVTCAALAFFLVGGIGLLARGPALTSRDQQLLLQFDAHRTGVTAGWMGVLTAIGSGLMAIPVGVAIVAVLLLRRRRRAAHCFGVTVLTGWALNAVLKEGFRRPRPDVIAHFDVAGWYSYPSGHSMLAPLVFGLGAFLLTHDARRFERQFTMTLAVLLCLGIAVSRVYLGVHYPSDVVGALLAGAGWAALGVAVYSPLDS